MTSLRRKEPFLESDSVNRLLMTREMNRGAARESITVEVEVGEWYEQQQ